MSLRVERSWQRKVDVAQQQICHSPDLVQLLASNEGSRLYITVISETIQMVQIVP